MLMTQEIPDDGKDGTERLDRDMPPRPNNLDSVSPAHGKRTTTRATYSKYHTGWENDTKGKDLHQDMDP